MTDQPEPISPYGPAPCFVDWVVLTWTNPMANDEPTPFNATPDQLDLDGMTIDEISAWCDAQEEWLRQQEGGDTQP